MVGKRKMKISRDTKSMWLTAYLFLLPIVLLWLFWLFIPAVKSFVISFFEYNYALSADNHFVGADNYIKLFQSEEFHLALKNTVLLVLAAVPVQSIIALMLAFVVNKKIKGTGFFRTVFFMPSVISSIAVATVFMYLFVMDKFIPLVLAGLGLKNVTWFADVKYAMPLICIMYIWQQAGFYMVIFLSGMQTIPGELMEAAAIDGAGSGQKFRYITVPMLKPITFLVLTHGAIGAFQVFDQIAAASGMGQLGSPAGSTSTLVTFFYLNSFKFGEIGYGSAAAVALFMIILIVTLIQKRVAGREE